MASELQLSIDQQYLQHPFYSLNMSGARAPISRKATGKIKQASTLTTDQNLRILANIVSKGERHRNIVARGVGGAVLLQHSPHYIRSDTVA